jgi:hypothetical protein
MEAKKINGITTCTKCRRTYDSKHFYHECRVKNWKGKQYTYHREWQKMSLLPTHHEGGELPTASVFDAIELANPGANRRSKLDGMRWTKCGNTWAKGTDYQGLYL